jgi:hypothetical protein
MFFGIRDIKNIRKPSILILTNAPAAAAIRIISFPMHSTE